MERDANDVASTGLYFNAATFQYECWAVDHRTGTRRLCGVIAAELPAEAVAMAAQDIWRASLVATVTRQEQAGPPAVRRAAP